MVFEETPIKKGVSKGAIRNEKNNMLSEIETGAMIWYLVKRHKFGLVSTYAVLVTLVWAVPALPSMVVDLFN